MTWGGPSNDLGNEYIVSARQPDASTSSATGVLANSATGVFTSSADGGLASSVAGDLASSATGGGYAEGDQKTSVVTAPNVTFGSDKFAFGYHVL